jgi:phosphoribosylanthranilate isomerase
MIKIKVCGMKDTQNARLVAETDPDMLGFIFYPGSKRYVGADPDVALFTQFKAELQKVGVFVDENPKKLLNLAKCYALDLVQLHGAETPADCLSIRMAGYKVIKAFGVDHGFDFSILNAFMPVCDFFLFDTKSDQHGGTGQHFNWEKLQEYDLDIPFFLGGGIGPEDAAAILELKHPSFFAVDINSRFEVEPGVKHVSAVNTFIKAIKTNTQ